jgi:hypothetical protein
MYKKGSGDDFFNPLLEIAHTFGKNVEAPDFSAVPFAGFVPGKGSNPTEQIVRGLEKQIREAHGGRPDNLESVYRMMFSSKDKARTLDAGILGELKGSVAYVRPTVEKAATRSARAIGEANSITSQAIYHVKEAVRGKGVGKILGVGAGIAAVTGLLSTSMKPIAGVSQGFEQHSSSRYRPEEMLGAEGVIPGLPSVGSLSSSPPRREVAPPPQVQTAVVAPMRRSADLEIRMKAQDRQSAAETSRIFGRLATDGTTNTNITYRSNARFGSLRMRDKIRTEMDRS